MASVNVKIGGCFYGMDIQKAMKNAHTMVVRAAKDVYGEDCTGVDTVRGAIECYEVALMEGLKYGD